MKIVAVIQARLGSSRLPRKVLADLAGEPMLSRVVERTRRCTSLDEVVVATTTEPEDDELADLCHRRNWPCFRGSQHDVLDRYYQAAKMFHADVVVRITSDCPFIDPDLVGLAVEVMVRQDPPLDYYSTTIPRRTFPRGLDTEVLRFSALKRAWEEARDPASREHVTLYVYQHPELFRIDGLNNEVDWSGYRWTVDTDEDLQFARTIYNHFGHDQFGWLEVLDVLKEHPHWASINVHIPQKPVMDGYR